MKSLSTDVLRSLPAQDADLIERLHPGLREVLARELRKGNAIREISSGWPNPTSIAVMLKLPFLASRSQLPRDIAFNEINDPHYWLAEFSHEESGQIVTCPFSR